MDDGKSDEMSIVVPEEIVVSACDVNSSGLDVVVDSACDKPLVVPLSVETWTVEEIVELSSVCDPVVVSTEVGCWVVSSGNCVGTEVVAATVGFVVTDSGASVAGVVNKLS